MNRGTGPPRLRRRRSWRRLWGLALTFWPGWRMRRPPTRPNPSGRSNPAAGASRSDRERSATMNLQDYLDPKRFPLTARPDYTPQQQLMMDAFNFDKFKEFADAGTLEAGRPTAIWD